MSVTKEEIKANESNSTFLYFAAKIFAEKAVWTFAKEHPELDVTTSQNSFHRTEFPPLIFPPDSSPCIRLRPLC